MCSKWYRFASVSLSRFSHVQLFVTPVDCSPPGSSVHGILQARIMEWVGMRSSRESFWPRDRNYSCCDSCIAGGFFIAELPGNPWYWSATAAAAKPLQSCPTLCDPIDGSPPGSPVPGILQARTLEWVAIAFSDTDLHSLIPNPWVAMCFGIEDILSFRKQVHKF